MQQSVEDGLLANDYKQLSLSYDEHFKALWFTMKPRPRPCFNTEILEELRLFQNRLVQTNQQALIRSEPPPFRYTIMASDAPGVFNYGGDLKLFARLIQKRDREGLQRYATACIDVLYPNAVNFNMPMTTISLVQGDALGGGFEAAISSNVVIAEKSARFGLPEILFNLIPGMGAFTLLIRRTSPDIAEKFITSGSNLTAEQMHALRLVDVVAEDGEGESAVREFLAKHHRRANAEAALQRVRQLVDPVTYEEMIQITHIWVDAALQLSDRDLSLIKHLASAQLKCIPDQDREPRAMEGRA